MLAHHFRNKETFKLYQWLNNTGEFYKQICQEIDMSPNSTRKVEEAIQNIVNSIMLSVESGYGSKYAHYMLEDLGDLSLICYDDIVAAFTEED